MNKDERSNPDWNESDLLRELADTIVRKFGKKEEAA
jgi:hypothetical protein